MGRPPKYKTDEERRDAQLATKREYYYRNRTPIRNQRKRHRAQQNSVRPGLLVTVPSEPSTELGWEEQQWNEQVAERKQLRMDMFALERKFTQLTANLGDGVLPELIRRALRKSDVDKAMEMFTSFACEVDELVQRVRVLNSAMDRAFAGGPDSKACDNLFYRISGLSHDLENAARYCSKGLDKLRAAQTNSIMRYQTRH
ncbi:hypothetical protein C8J56DRAFT_993716 [Mycena floridula]|nr:hypothetical protein C8J56DRAFT_993716 [Mycena floridula]